MYINARASHMAAIIFFRWFIVIMSREREREALNAFNLGSIRAKAIYIYFIVYYLFLSLSLDLLTYIQYCAQHDRGFYTATYLYTSVTQIYNCVFFLLLCAYCYIHFVYVGWKTTPDVSAAWGLYFFFFFENKMREHNNKTIVLAL